MKRIIACLLVAVLAFTLGGCQPDSSYFDEEGNYIGFENVSENYTPEDAIADGCLVRYAYAEQGEPEADHTPWKTFWETSQNGEDAFLRVATFTDYGCMYEDLLYQDGRYRLFFHSWTVELQERANFRHLLRLTSGTAYAPVYYVLTDDAELTYDYVSKHMPLSSLPDIPYTWLDFATEFYDPDAPDVVPFLDEEGLYNGFDDLPSDYTPEEAIADGCFVVKDGTLLAGREAWETFLEQSGRGENAFLRVVQFIDGERYYDDLRYYNGLYRLNSLDPEIGPRGSSGWKYLRALYGGYGYSTSPSPTYVLTSSLELTAKDVQWVYLSSNFNDHTDIPFTWLSFTTYLHNNDT